MRRGSRSPVGAPADTVGAETLERLSATQAFNRWMYGRLARWIQGDVLEVGSGIGNMSAYLVDRPKVVLTDVDPAYRKILALRFGHLPHVRVATLHLPHVEVELRSQRFHTVVCLNVLEHIQDDIASLMAMRDLLDDGGHLVLLVPALRGLYGTLDEALGHYRRYTPHVLRQRFAAADLTLRRLEWFNLAGIPGWWFVGRVLRRTLLPTSSLRLYNALVPLFRLERFLPWRIGQSLIAVGERET